MGELLNAHHPNGLHYNLWFIGVMPDFKNKGAGSKLLNDVLERCDERKRPIYLETSVTRNLPWYERFGFEVFIEVNLDYTLYQLIRE